MKIAFDVKGTLIGYHQDKVLKLFYALQSMGCEMFVWSNSINYAFEAVKTHSLKVDAQHVMYKYTTVDVEVEGIEAMDVAIEDDRSQTYLGAKRIIFVDEIPEEPQEMALFIKNILKGREIN